MWFFFFNDTATTEIYTLSLHDALPISTAAADRQRLEPVAHQGERRGQQRQGDQDRHQHHGDRAGREAAEQRLRDRSEEHTSELQSRQYLVCRLLLEKKHTTIHHPLIIE